MIGYKQGLNRNGLGLVGLVVGLVGSVVGLVGLVVGLVVGRVGGAHPPFLGGCPSPLPTTTIKSKKKETAQLPQA